MEALTTGITLKGSAQIVAKFFDTCFWYLKQIRVFLNNILDQSECELATGYRYKIEHVLSSKTGYGVNSILYQRGLYPEETFQRVQDFGVPLFVTTIKEISDYLEQHTKYIEEWLEKLTLQKLVVLIRNIDNGEVMERWQFNVECDKTITDNIIKEKSEAEIRKEIQHVMRNILASNAILPIYDCPCSFEIVIYTDKEQVIPDTWRVTEAGIIDNSQEIRLKSYDTTIHKVSTSVAYKKIE